MNTPVVCLHMTDFDSVDFVKFSDGTLLLLSEKFGTLVRPDNTVAESWGSRETPDGPYWDAYVEYCGVPGMEHTVEMTERDIESYFDNAEFETPEGIAAFKTAVPKLM